MTPLQQKKKLLAKIESINDDLLIAELLGLIEQHQVVKDLSEQQKRLLKERISLVEEGEATYTNAKQALENIKKKLRDL